jgi:hypothetical protein
LGRERENIKMKLEAQWQRFGRKPQERAGRMAQVVEWLLSKHESEFKFQYHQIKKRKKNPQEKL